MFARNSKAAETSTQINVNAANNPNSTTEAPSNGPPTPAALAASASPATALALAPAALAPSALAANPTVVPLARSSFGTQVSETPASDDVGSSVSPVSNLNPVAQSERLTLSWTGIFVKTIPKGLGKKRLPSKEVLSDVTGIVHPGAMMAVMGASGAGKTTLLNILNFRTKNSPDLKVQGKVMLNGHLVDASDMAEVSAFVQQEDIFLPQLTCREHLEFHATLRMKHKSGAQKSERVDEVIAEMGLKRCENVLIGGNQEKGISGGEMKRLNFATEILCRRNLIFCDEPTSGLDSYMAMELVKLLKRYASVGNTILCTIHQPSSQIFTLFDYICIMAEGRCAFIGKAHGCLDVFVDAGFPSPMNYNPIDHYIFTLAVMPGQEDACRGKITKVTESFGESETYAGMIKEIKELKKAPTTEAFWRPDNDVCTKIKKSTTGCSSFLHGFLSFGMIFKRQLKTTIREPVPFLLRLFLGAFMSVVLGLTFLKVNIRDDASVTNVPGALFSFITMAIFAPMMVLVMVIPVQSPIIARDYLSGVYKIPTYYITVTIYYTVGILLTTLLNTSIVFWMIFGGTDVDTMVAFPRFLGVVLMAALVATGMGMLFSAIANTYEQATSYVNLTVIFMIFAGFLIPQDEIWPIFKVFQYLSAWFYTQELAMWFVYGDLPSLCQYVGPNMTFVTTLEDEIMNTTKPAEFRDLLAEICLRRCEPSKNPRCCDNYLSGQGHLDRFQLGEHVYRDLIALVGLMLGMHIVAITVLTTKMYFKKK